MALSAATVLAVLASVIVPATAVSAAEPAAVRNVKTANATEVGPGDTFNWMIEVGCSVLDDECVNAVLTDTMPDEFILPDPQDILLTPELAASERTITVTGQTLTIDFHQDLTSPSGEQGLANGTITVTVPVTVRSDLDHTPTPRTIENTSQMVADNAPMLPSTASVVLDVPLELATEPAKSFSPSTNIAVAGLETELTLGGTNASNAPVSTLTIQDPADPAASGNIFGTALELQSLGAVTWPAGATTATVSVWDASLPTPGWVAADPVDEGEVLALPAAVDPADAAGIRIEFSSGATPAIPRGASASFLLDLANRTGLTEGSYPNTAQSTVARDALSATTPVTATYTVTEASSSVAAGKTIEPERMSTVAYGASDLTNGTVTLTGTNTGSIPLQGLTISEPSDPTTTDATNPFSPAHPGGGLIFAGFTPDVAWPSGATAASITYYYSDGSNETLTGTAPGLPAAEGTKRVTGFSVTFTGAMPQGEGASLPFTIEANPLQVAPNLSQLYTNESAVSGVDLYDQQVGPESDSDTVTVLADQITVSTSKSVTRNQLRAQAGQSTTATLTTRVAEYPLTTRSIDHIEMIDPPTENGLTDWYDHFDASQLANTQVPDDATLTIYYRDINGVYTELTSFGPGTHTYQIPTGVRDDIYGIKLSWDSTTGFQPGQTLVANLGYTLRGDLRESGTALPNAAAELENCSSSGGASIMSPDTILSNLAVSDPCATVSLVPTETGQGGGADILDKKFINVDNTTGQGVINTRNAERTRARLSWSTDGYNGVDQMVVYDGPLDLSGEPNPGFWARGMYDAFDLVRIPAINSALDPLLQYDRVYVELYDRVTGWGPAGFCTITAPCDGSTPAYNLSSTERADTIAVRFVFTERPDRTGLDPAPGTGVAESGAHNRHIDLVFELRDDLRSDASTPVVDGYEYNEPVSSGHSVIRNDAWSQASLASGGTYTDREADTIELRDPQLAVDVTKTWAGETVPIPDETVTVRPTTRVTITGLNQTVGKVDSLTISEPNPTAATPNDSPFEQFDLLRFQSIAHPAGATGLTITVARTAGGDLIASGTPAAAATTALGWTTAELEDATGFTFSYTGRIDGVGSSSAASIVFDLALRATMRTGGAAVTAGTVYNSTHALVADRRWNPDGSAVEPTFHDETLGAVEGDAVELAASDISVTTSKIFVTTTEIEPARDAFRMSLVATPGGSERVQTLTITDDRATFWNAFDFVGLPTTGGQLTLPAFSPAPAGSGTVIQVEACVDSTWDATAVAASPDADCVTRGGHWTGAGTWKTQSQARAGFLPAGVSAGAVEGIRVTVKRLDDSQWENPKAPTITIPLLVQRRTDLRTGAAVLTDLAGNPASPGETTPGITTNSLTADVLGIWGKTGSASNTAAYRYTYATSEVRVQKTPAGVKAPGRVFDYTLSVTNTGNWPIMNPVITDNLPSDGVGAQLVFDPDKPWTYEYALTGDAPSPANGTPLPTGTTGPDVDVQADAYGPEQLTFTFPEGSVLEVGQTYVITIPMMFRPGLANDVPVTNSFSVRGDRGFDDCTAPTGFTADYDDATGECSTSTTVRPAEQAALRALMTVRPELDAEYPTDLGYTGATGCETAVDAAGFSRLPCVPLTLPGQKETWRLTAQNTGTTQLPRVVLSTRLPDVGDKTILDGFARNSQWAAGFADEITADLGIPGATMTVYYTTASAPCTSVLTDPFTPTACPSDPATGWAEWTAGALADPSIVTGLQFVIDFPDDDLFSPADIVTIDVVTRTAALSSTPGADTRANNSLSASAITRTGTTDTAVTALDYSVVSVALATGSVVLDKEITGDAASFLPDGQVFTGELVCVSDGETTTRPFSLTADTSTVPATVEGMQFDDLPGGAECTATETQASGQTEYTATTAVVDPLADAAALPTVDLVNDYRLAGITVSKTVTTTAGTVPEDYAFTLGCTFLGVAVPLATGDAAFTLDDGESKTVTGIPANSDCVVTEADAKGADATIVTAQTDPGHPDASVVVDNTARTATFTRLSPDTVDGVTNTVIADNRFDAPAAMVITKHLLGGGAEQFGAGKTFSVDVQCSFESTTQYDGTVELSADNAWQAVIENVIAGSSCTFAETGLQGADAVVVTPNDGTDETVGVLVVPGPSDAEPSPVVDIDVTNWYLTGAVEVTKTFAGDDGAIEKFAVDPAVEFEFELSCLRDGEEVVIPGGATRTVTAASPVADYTGLASGAECTIAETRDGGASLSRVLDENGDELADGAFTVTVDGTVLSADDQEQPGISIENTFRFAEVAAAKTVVDASGDRGAGPFEVTLLCTLDGRDIQAAEPAAAAIRGGETVTWTELAEGAECTLEETDAGGATRTTTSLTAADGTQGPAVEGTTVVLEPLRWTGDDAPNRVELVNSFRLAYTGASTDLPVLLLLPLALLLGGAALVLSRVRRRRPGAHRA